MPSVSPLMPATAGRSQLLVSLSSVSEAPTSRELGVEALWRALNGDIRQFAPLPSFHPLSHRLEISLHPVQFFQFMRHRLIASIALQR